MFRTKKDVERHVLDVLSKINSENEKNLRGYTFARLFFQVKDYDAARKYLSGFLSVRDHHAPAHKLMAQIYEATNSPENALQSYKRSLEIDSHQIDLVLKICELYCLLPVDHETAKYWADRAEQIYPHNEIVFKLRECLVSAEGDPDHQELENLIATELQAQPKNIDLRIKLLRLYLDTERIKEAYEHATLIESKMLFPSSCDWYYMLSEIYEVYQEECKQDLDSQFFINYLTALDRLIYLNLSEVHSRENSRKCSLNDAAEFLFTYDNCLKKAAEQNMNEGSWTYFMHHMKGQLFFYMTTILLKKAKMDQGNRKEALRFSAGLALICYGIRSTNPLEELWFSQLTENQKVFTNLFQQGSIRTSFIGHVIKSFCKEDKSKWLQRIKSDVCIFQVKERIYNRIFSSVKTKKNLSTSFFFDNSTFENSSLEFPSQTSLNDYDKAAYKLCASSLHHLVWLQLQGEINTMKNCLLTEIFKGLQYSNKNLSKGSCESLCILDLEAYLNATVYQAKAGIEKKKATINNWNQDLSASCPPDIADPMCSELQGEWWRIAYGLHNCSIKEKLGESRRVLQQGLEVIRGVGNHGMEVQLVVHLAQSFASRTEVLLKDYENTNTERKVLPDNVTALQLRATHYWNVAIGILEKLMSGGIIKPPKEPMFIGYEYNLSKTEMRNLLEDGKLYMAVQFMEADKLNEAAEILSKLSSPYGSFYLALTLKKFASQEDKFSNSRKVFLSKAQRAIHDTMDRIKDDNSHPLNREIHIVLEDIENELGTGHSISNGTSDEPDEVDAYDASITLNSSIYTTPNSFILSKQSTPKPSSKFMSSNSKMSYTNSDYPKHSEPSPERLDAQIRALTLNQDTVIKAVMEQNKSLLETNKSINETLKKNNELLSDLKKQFDDWKLFETRTHPKTTVKNPSYLKGQGDNEFENFDPNALLEYYEENNEEYRVQDYNYNPQPRMVQEATAPLNYVVPPSLPPGPPPSLAHYNYQYPPHAMLPPAAVPERSQFYPPPGQSLPFSEGQQLPQFHFHVSSAMVKPPAPILSNVTNIPHPATLPPSAINLPQPSSLVQTSRSAIPSSPWTKPVGVPPHQFQIPLPPSGLFGTASHLVQQSTSPTSSSAVTSQTTLRNLLSTTTSGSSPLSNYVLSSATNTTITSNLFSSVAKSPEQIKAERSRCDSENAGSEVDGHDIEREVMGDFKPLIPLPDEIVVKTGEENEVVLFEDRAKLFRYVDQEWKERGVGIIKLLHHKESERVRLLMRRDQVLKVCANHYILPDMEIKPLKTSDRAWTWVAQDFADEELKPEQFCIRLKTSELALAFKEAFEKAISLVRNSDAEIKASPNKPSSSSSPGSKPFASKFLPKSGSWSCPTCYISNSADMQFCEACETKKPGFANITTSPVISIPSSSISVTPLKSSSQFTFGSSGSVNKTAETEYSSKSVFGGFTFSSSPTIHEVNDPDPKEREILVVSTKSKDGPQVTKVSNAKSSPFSGFSFTSSPPSVSKPSDSYSEKPFIAETKTASNAPYKDFGFPSLSATPTAITKNTEVSNFSFKMPDLNTNTSNAPFTNQLPDFSFKLQASWTPDASTQSQKLPDSVSSLSKLQSMVQNVTPTFVFNPNDAPVSSSAASFTQSTDKGSSQSFSPIVSNLNTSAKSNDTAPEEFVPTAEFIPVVPLPALVDLKTGEEGEEIKFCERARLFRYDLQTKEWKERGTGELKILFVKDSQKYRILMRRDQVLKICANHYILPEMKLEPLSNNDKAWVWFAHDYSENELSQEKLAARFKSVDIAKQFFNVFEKCQNELRQNEKEIKDLCIGNKDAFDKLFEPSPDSWQCSKCHKYNSNQSSCIFCKTPYKNAASVTETQKPDNQKSLYELFKPAAGSWECSQCYVRNQSTDLMCKSCESAKPGMSCTKISSNESEKNNKSLSELFKPPPGSWVCQTCMIRNTSDKTLCQSCETPKPGSIDSSEKMPNSQSNFSFNSVPSASSAFSFGLPASGNGFVFGSKPATQPSTFTFGQSALTKADQVTGFKPTLPATSSPAVFGGTTQKPSANISIPPISTAPTYVFGSTATTNFSFSSLTSQKPASDPESVEFRFGSPQKYEFNFSGVRPRSPTKTPKSPRSPATPSDVEEDDEVVSSDADNIYFSPVIPLPPKVEVKTGEESENALFTQRAKLYRFCDGEWKERGLGDVKILFDDKTKKARLLMRREQVLKVCLNHSLTKDIKFDWRGDKSLTWAATDFSENEAIPELFAIRFKTAELALEFKESIDNAFSLIEEQKPNSSSDMLKSFSFKVETTPKKLDSNFTPGSLSARFGALAQEDTKETSNNSPFSFSFKDKPDNNSFFSQTSFGGNDPKPVFGTGLKFGFGSNTQTTQLEDDDVQVVFEDLPSPEKVAKAEQLMLPKTFYLYENKEACPGCVGCTDTILPCKGEIGEEEEKTEKKEHHDTKPGETGFFGSSSISSISFTDLASGKSSQPFITSPSGGKHGFAGAGTPIFSSSHTSGEAANDDTVPENPDIHFEPVIPLPDLIEVKTGEEDETPIFAHRAKLFRFDGPSKQWKERGIGDIKILKHKEKTRFRVILRRDQVHNIACNHSITSDMSLSPLATSDNALCWNAVDFSDGQAEGTKFAVRFKAKDILEKFKQVFNDCIEIVRQNPPTLNEENSGAERSKNLNSSQPEVESSESPIKNQPKPNEESIENEDQNSDDISDEDELLFEKRLTYEIIDGNQSIIKSIGTLQMTYDDSVYGYRVTIVNDEEEVVCDHVIAVQNCLRVDGKKAFWSAIDISVEPPKKRHFIATFSSLDAVNEYQKYFEEGKEFAVKSGIVENEDYSANLKGQ